jgi:Methyltransferase domain
MRAVTLPMIRERGRNSIRSWWIYRAFHGLGHHCIRTVARSLNYDIVWRTFYNGVPHLDEIPADVWARRSSMSGVAIDRERSRLAVEELIRFALDDGFSPPPMTEQRGTYFTENGGFGLRDAAVLWGMLRRLKPRRVIEVGSGYSTMVIAAALDTNDLASEPAQHLVIDPFPQVDLIGGIARPFELVRRSVTDVRIPQFEELAADDVLFVDTTHTVKVGGDVTFLILDVLPALRAGVHVHFHDIFLPCEYPQTFFELGYNWAEQYLLQAFLQFNTEFEVLAPLHLLAVERAAVFSRLDATAPSSSRECGSFWIRRADTRATSGVLMH